eukprot:CAMPEP_0204579480 /NCGR_PEP_ID=MMETSP0661-20131031/43513_1 /ASSEMBLY_ACC=CAM_ASM_000606 /TAXON_ID=109239 /ORGANISM="Alexandrium margalefi, Strain AMGDE01CS-322" /LENGTH=101 /DNA_ID=CAMNT_0051588493 /DNA_START=84 /DNA_END=389 /DNA_ORIENTATION=-
MHAPLMVAGPHLREMLNSKGRDCPPHAPRVLGPGAAAPGTPRAPPPPRLPARAVGCTDAGRTAAPEASDRPASPPAASLPQQRHVHRPAARRSVRRQATLE